VNFQLGDIVEIYSPIAGKTKYHLFVVKMSDFGVSLFFFFNSKSGYDAEISICPDDVSGLPPSPTGDSVISFNMFIRYGEEKLTKFRARKIGKLSAAKTKEVIECASLTPALPFKDRKVLKEILVDLP
jgi:hypothetical protein